MPLALYNWIHIRIIIDGLRWTHTHTVKFNNIQAAMHSGADTIYIFLLFHALHIHTCVEVVSGPSRLSSSSFVVHEMSTGSDSCEFSLCCILSSRFWSYILGDTFISSMGSNTGLRGISMHWTTAPPYNTTTSYTEVKPLLPLNQ